MKLQVKVNPETGVIDDAKFKTFGCGSAIASSSLATEWLKGKTVDQALAIKNTDIVAELSLPPVKIHCSVLAEDAIKAAIADYKKKQDEDEGRSTAGSTRSRTRKHPTPRRPERRSLDWKSALELGIDMIRDHRDRRAQDQVADGQAGHQRWRSSCGREGRRLLGLELHVRLGAAAAARRRGLRGPRREDLRRQEELSVPQGHDARLRHGAPDEGFVFNNPNAKQTCGCGSSFGA